MSLDGFSAGLNQDLENPLGIGGHLLMDWFFHTRTWRHMHGLEGGETGVDDTIAAAGLAGLGAWILGRNMFGPVRAPWPDDKWKGWWGEEPPYHVPAFVLTHHPRAPVSMAGGTEFRFVTDGIHAALKQARAAAGGTSAWAVASPRFGSIWRPHSSMSSTSLSGPSSSVPGKRCSWG